MAELMALEQCLEILIESNLHNAIIEVDSELIINSVKNICNGTTPERVSKHWQLLHVYQRIQSHLRALRTLSFVHVRRTANRLAYCLTNEGVHCSKSNRRYAWMMTPSGKLREDCHRQATKDREHFQSMRNKQREDQWKQ